MGAGDAVASRPGNDGVSMVEGDPSEPVGPEDAAGQGVKRGDYSGRGDSKDVHLEYGTDSNGDLQVRDEVAAMNTDPGVPDAGEKGGVDSYDAATDEGGPFDSDPEAEVQTVTVDATSFTLHYDGEDTADLVKAATNGAEVLTALEALTDDVASVTGADGGPYVVTFKTSVKDAGPITGTGTGGAATVTVVETNKGN